MDDLIESYVTEAEKPLTPYEQRQIAKANVYIMDVEVDGGSFPKRIEQLNNLRRRLTPDEDREVLAWFDRNAPGNY